jgi:hypothetical protein
VVKEVVKKKKVVKEVLEKNEEEYRTWNYVDI